MDIKIKEIIGVKYFRELGKNKCEFSFDFSYEGASQDNTDNKYSLSLIINRNRRVLDINNLQPYLFSDTSKGEKVHLSEILLFKIQTLIASEAIYNRLGDINYSGDIDTLLKSCNKNKLIYINFLDIIKDIDSKILVEEKFVSNNWNTRILKDKEDSYVLIFCKKPLISVNTNKFSFDELVKTISNYANR